MKPVPLLALLLILAFFTPHHSQAQVANEVGPDRAYFKVYDFQKDWLTYSSQYNNYVPYAPSIDEEQLSISALVDLIKNRRYKLLISTKKENYLFIEGALQTKLSPDSWLVLDIDSLYRTYKKEEILLTLYGSVGPEGKTLLIGHPRQSSIAQPNATKGFFSLINIKPLPTSSFQDFSILLILFLLILILFTYYISPVQFRRFINLIDVFDSNERNELYRFNKPYSRIMVFMALIVSSSMGYLLLYLYHSHLDLLPTNGMLSAGNNLGELLTDQLKLTGFFILLFFLKYIFMGIVAGVLNIQQVVNAHYIKALQISFVVYSIVILVVFASAMQNPRWIDALSPYILYGVIVYYMIRMVLLYLFTNYSSRFINLYLFSYLCVLEIIPLIIGVKFAT